MDTTIDLTLLFLGPIIGAVLGLFASIIVSVLARKALAKSAMASSVLGRVRGPAYFALATWGAWVGLGIALVTPASLTGVAHRSRCSSCTCSSSRAWPA